MYIQGIYITRAKSAIQMLIYNKNHAESDLATVRKGTPKKNILDDFWGVWEPTNSPRLQITVYIEGNQSSGSLWEQSKRKQLRKLRERNADQGYVNFSRTFRVF